MHLPRLDDVHLTAYLPLNREGGSPSVIIKVTTEAAGLGPEAGGTAGRNLPWGPTLLPTLCGRGGLGLPICGFWGEGSQREFVRQWKGEH